jgi:hypothetical protein
MDQKDNGTWYENPGGIVQSNEWYTPPEVFISLKVDFDLDVASPKEKIPWLPTEYWFSKDDDGLKKDWFGFVWCNPPYGKDTGLWLDKFVEHGNGIALVFARTDTRWFHDYAIKADILCFIKGRLAFYKPHAVDQYVQAKQGSTGSLLLGCGDKAVHAIEQAKLGYNIRNDF